MRRILYVIATVIIGLLICVGVNAAPVVYNDEAAFGTAAAPTTTYGFENHGFAESGSPPHTGDLTSPLAASNLANNFDLAYTNQNAFSIWNSAPSPWLTEGTRYLWTHSTFPAVNYTLTFSNFGGSNAAITAFGITIINFASSLDLQYLTTITHKLEDSQEPFSKL